MRDVLSRSKFDKPLAQHGKTRTQVIEAYLAIVQVIEASPIPAAVSRDPDDDLVLACAVGGEAEVIVSGDDDLVSLGVYQNIPIMTASQFLVWWQTQHASPIE